MSSWRATAITPSRGVLLYNLQAVHGIIEARNSINLAAFELQQHHNIKLATPLTHTFPTRKNRTASNP